MDAAEKGKDDAAAGKRDRLPYEPPRILSREVIEALAAACTDINAKPDSISCPFGTPQS